MENQQILDMLGIKFKEIFDEDKKENKDRLVYRNFFTDYTSEHAQEVDVQLNLKDIQELTEQQKKENVKNITTYIHDTFSLCFQITPQDIEDNLYLSKFTMYAKSLFNTYYQFLDFAASKVFNEAFDEENEKALCHPDHKNSFSEELSKESFQKAIIRIGEYKDSEGRLLKIVPKMLMVPPHLQFKAYDICGFPAATTNSDINAIYPSYPYIFVNNYLEPDCTSWFLLTDAPEGLKHFIREEDEVDSYFEDKLDERGDKVIKTGNLNFRITGRHSFGFTNPQCVFGSSGKGS